MTATDTAPANAPPAYPFSISHRDWIKRRFDSFVGSLSSDSQNDTVSCANDACPLFGDIVRDASGINIDFARAAPFNFSWRVNCVLCSLLPRS
jgi:hypothetical protein